MEDVPKDAWRFVPRRKSLLKPPGEVFAVAFPRGPFYSQRFRNWLRIYDAPLGFLDSFFRSPVFGNCDIVPLHPDEMTDVGLTKG